MELKGEGERSSGYSVGRHRSVLSRGLRKKKKTKISKRHARRHVFLIFLHFLVIEKTLATQQLLVGSSFQLGQLGNDMKLNYQKKVVVMKNVVTSQREFYEKCIESIMRSVLRKWDWEKLDMKDKVPVQLFILACQQCFSFFLEGFL